jgi:putative phage-type endonuclease
MILRSDPLWATARVGHVTASRIADVVARSRDKKEWGVSRKNYAADLIAERLTGKPIEGYRSAEMQRGNEVEAEAIAAYAFLYDVDIGEGGFLKHPRLAWAGASPDGLVGDDGLVEFKCPNTATHIATFLGAKIDNGYALQMQWQMAGTGRQWCDFTSYDPRLPEELSMHVQRVMRDDEKIGWLEREVEIFNQEIEATIAELLKAAA